MSGIASEINYKLEKPIEVEGTPYTELTFREPDLDLLIAIEEHHEGGEMAQNAMMFARMAGVPEAVIRKLKAREFFAILKTIQPWLDELGKLLAEQAGLPAAPGPAAPEPGAPQMAAAQNPSRP